MKSNELLNTIIHKVNVSRGAPMGRANVGSKPKHETIFDRAVPFVDGAYDKGGAYWGVGVPLRVAYNKSLTYIEFYRSNTPLHKQGATYQRKTKIEYQLWSNYGYGWEHETTEDTYQELKEQIKCYKANSSGHFKMVFKRVKI